MRSVFIRCLISLFTILSTTDLPAADYPAFRTGVQRAIANRRLHLLEPRLDWSGHSLDYTFPNYDFEDTPDDSQNPRLSALESQLTVEAIRRFRMTNLQRRRFWAPVLADVESEIAKMLDLADRPGFDVAAVEQRQVAIRNVYQESLDRLARQYGKQGAGRSEQEGVIFIDVRLPAGGFLKYMSAGKYEMHQILENAAPSLDNRLWLDMVPGAGTGIAELSCFAYQAPDGRVRNWTISANYRHTGLTLVATLHGLRWER
jgi:hypothetical protein